MKLGISVYIQPVLIEFTAMAPCSVPWCVHMMHPGCGTGGTIRSGDNQLHCHNMVH